MEPVALQDSNTNHITDDMEVEYVIPSVDDIMQEYNVQEEQSSPSMTNRLPSFTTTNPRPTEGFEIQSNVREDDTNVNEHNYADNYEGYGFQSMIDINKKCDKEIFDDQHNRCQNHMSCLRADTENPMSYLYNPLLCDTCSCYVNIINLAAEANATEVQKARGLEVAGCLESFITNLYSGLMHVEWEHS